MPFDDTSTASSRNPLIALVGSLPLEATVGSQPLIVGIDNWVPVKVIVTVITDSGAQLFSDGIPVTFATSS